MLGAGRAFFLTRFMTPFFSPQRERWLLLTIAGIQFTHILDFMIMMPLGPQFTRLFGISDAQFGLLVSAYTLSAGASGLAAATYVDRFDRKHLLLWLYGLFAIATLACGLATSYGFLMMARVAAGLFGGVLSALSQTIVADVVPFERRGRAMGIVMSSFSVATVAGVPIGLFIASLWGWQLTFVAIALFSAVLGVGAWLTLPRLRAHLDAPRTHSVWRGIGRVLVHRDHLLAFAFSALLMFTGFTVIPFITLYMQANLGMTDTQIPYVYLCGGIATLIKARFFGRLTDRLGKVRTFTFMGCAVTLPLMATTLIPPPRTAVGSPAGVHWLLRLHERPHDPRHGPHHVGTRAAAARHLSRAQRGGAVGRHGRGLVPGRLDHQPRRQRPSRTLRLGRAGGRCRQPGLRAARPPAASARRPVRPLIRHGAGVPGLAPRQGRSRWLAACCNAGLHARAFLGIVIPTATRDRRVARTARRFVSTRSIRRLFI